jgi:hypothetical protein
MTMTQLFSLMIMPSNCFYLPFPTSDMRMYWQSFSTTFFPNKFPPLPFSGFFLLLWGGLQQELQQVRPLPQQIWISSAWTNELQRLQTQYVGFSFSWPVNRLCGILFNRFYRLEIHSLVVCIFDPAFDCCPDGQRNYTCVLWPQSTQSSNVCFRAYIQSWG